MRSRDISNTTIILGKYCS